MVTVDVLRKSMQRKQMEMSETNENALKVSPILEGAHGAAAESRCQAMQQASFTNEAKTGGLDLLHIAFDFAAPFDFEFTISHIASDLACVANNQHIFAGHGLIEFALDVDEFSFRGACDHT